jgi:cysteine synthase A
LSLVAAVKGYKVILVMPESMSIERRKLMEIYGAKFELTPKEKGMKGAIEKAAELVKEIPNAWSPQQFDNPANIEIHKTSTALEILTDFPDGLDYIITGVGTGGHITGISKVLKAKFPNLKVIAVEPALSPVLAGGNPGPHPIHGIGAGFIPKNYHADAIDEVIAVSKEEAYEFARQIARKEGILAGISTGASLAAVSKKLESIPQDAKVLTFNYDTGERYLSVEGLF